MCRARPVEGDVTSFAAAGIVEREHLIRRGGSIAADTAAGIALAYTAENCPPAESNSNSIW